MPKKYPVLKLSEVLEILKKNGFALHNQKGSHAQFVLIINEQTRRVTVDTGKEEFDEFLLKSMISQSGLSREEFYGSCKSAAKKINLANLNYPQKSGLFRST